MKSVCYSATEKKNFKTCYSVSIIKRSNYSTWNTIKSIVSYDRFRNCCCKGFKKVFNNTNISYCHFRFARTV